MYKVTTSIILAIAALIFLASANLGTIGEKHVRLMANKHRAAIGATLLDIHTGEPVSCTTDTDCYNKTGINY